MINFSVSRVNDVRSYISSVERRRSAVALCVRNIDDTGLLVYYHAMAMLGKFVYSVIETKSIYYR